MKINVSPKGRNVGYIPKKKKGSDKLMPITEAAIEMARIGSEMEDATEKAITRIDTARQQTLKKAEM